MNFVTLSGDAVLTVNSGATSGAKTSALTFNYAIGGGDLGVADAVLLADDTAAATLTLTAATYNDRMLLVEVETDRSSNRC